MSKAFLIYGASGHAKVLIDALASTDTIVGLYDDDSVKIGQYVLGHQVLGNRLSLLEKIKSSNQSFYVVIAIGNNDVRKRIYVDLKEQNVHFGLIQHATANVSAHCVFGEGSVIFSRVVIQADTTVGKNVIINTGAIIEHDCKIADHVHIAPGAVLCGGVSVGEGSMIGAGATVIQGISIGSNVMVAAGAVVTKNLADNILVAGCPARVIKNREGKYMNVVNDLAKWPFYAADEIDAVVNVLKSGKVNYWTGQECKLFEKEYAESIGCQYAISLMNGTVALELALIALEIKSGDEVITPSRTFMASTSCIIARGAIPVFAEVDRVSQNVTAATIEAAITPRTKAVIVVHHAGWPCEMDKIMELAKRRNIYVIEDCAQAHGAMYKGKAVGSWGHVAAFSFCQDKIITTGGEGGLLTTNDKVFWERAWSYKDHGKDYDTVFNKAHPPGFRWIHASFGSNWRMTEMQAAIGRLQLRKLPEWTRIRTRCANLFTEAFAKIPALRVTPVPEGVEHACYRYYMFVRSDELKPDWNRDRIMQEINKRGVICLSGGCPEVYLEKSFDHTPYRPAQRFPIAKELGETSLALLLHPTLSKSEVQHSIAVVVEVMRQAY